MTGVDDDNFHWDTAREILFASDLITSACASCPRVGKKRPEGLHKQCQRFISLVHQEEEKVVDAHCTRSCPMSIKEKVSWLTHKMKRRWLMHKIANRLIVSPATPIKPSRLQSGWTFDNDISIVHLQRQSPDFDYQQKIRFLRKCWSSQTHWVRLIPLFWFHIKGTACSRWPLEQNQLCLARTQKLPEREVGPSVFFSFALSIWNVIFLIQNVTTAQWLILRCVGMQRNKSFHIRFCLWFDSLFVVKM